MAQLAPPDFPVERPGCQEAQAREGLTRQAPAASHGARPVVLPRLRRVSAGRSVFPAGAEGRNFFRPSEEVSHAAIIHPW